MESNPSLPAEIYRLAGVQNTISLIPKLYSDTLNYLTTVLAKRTVQNSEIVAAGHTLFQEGCQYAKTRFLDDRSLYWARLFFIEMLFNSKLGEAYPFFETASRNLLHGIGPTNAPIVITGFDPFSLNQHLSQTNPSGAFALALNATKVADLPIRSMVFPVRYRDFDNGLVEQALEPLLLSPHTKLVITVSMGRDGFDFERFPGNCRRSKNLDNEDIDITQQEGSFAISDDAPQFLEFSLPINGVPKRRKSVPIRDNRYVTTVEDGRVIAKNLEQLAGKTAIEGSGGNFLSNEIAYRVLLLQSKLGTQLPIGHIHVPRIEDYDAKQLDQDFTIFKELLEQIASNVLAS